MLELKHLFEHFRPADEKSLYGSNVAKFSMSTLQAQTLKLSTLTDSASNC